MAITNIDLLRILISLLSVMAAVAAVSISYYAGGRKLGWRGGDTIRR